jgi:hypothetical protein
VFKMDLSVKTSPSHAHRRDMLLTDGRSGAKHRRCRADVDLEIGQSMLSDDAVRALLDEWIVPIIVESVIGDLWNSWGGK